MSAWQRMLSGRRLNLLDPSPLDIEIADIAHGLARVARWNGQTSGEFALSVAQHSVLVEEIAAAYAPKLDLRWRLAALLHDSPEYVFGDMVSPLKRRAGHSQAELERRLLKAIHQRMGLPSKLPQEVSRLIKRADRASAWLEGTRLAGYSREEADRLWGHPELQEWEDMRLEPVSPPQAASMFESRALELLAELRRGKRSM